MKAQSKIRRYSRALFSARKGQSTIEFLAITLVALAVLTPVLIIAFDAFQQNTERVSLNQGQIAADRLKDAANSICALPNSTKKEVAVTLPNTIDLDKSSFGKHHSRLIALAIDTADRMENVTATASCTVSGTFPNSSGTFYFVVEKDSETSVRITPR